MHRRSGIRPSPAGRARTFTGFPHTAHRSPEVTHVSCVITPR
ncbi:hypothetical protein RAJCM14343_5244 [Rhodococcus aetherivorans]|uniref:Uncharacterized protein n=1 Tax=Rhodococcus aetherivorans TaxID=191292 RepID=A0ABQ0YTJ5_9NOCA|nr:hypothetical protein RAJCM14343_5244 [Rhodococcus aetherivorans]